MVGSFTKNPYSCTYMNWQESLENFPAVRTVILFHIIYVLTRLVFQEFKMYFQTSIYFSMQVHMAPQKSTITGRPA